MRHGKHFLSMIDRWSSGFLELTMSSLSDLKQLFRTDRGQSLVFPPSEPHAWDVALRNTFAPGSGVTAVMEYYRSSASAT